MFELNVFGKCVSRGCFLEGCVGIFCDRGLNREEYVSVWSFSNLSRLGRCALQTSHAQHVSFRVYASSEGAQTKSSVSLLSSGLMRPSVSPSSFSSLSVSRSSELEAVFLLFLPFAVAVSSSSVHKLARIREKSMLQPRQPFLRFFGVAFFLGVALVAPSLALPASRALRTLRYSSFAYLAELKLASLATASQSICTSSAHVQIATVCQLTSALPRFLMMPATSS